MNLRQDRKVVHIGIALDESGSMAGCKKETISGLNEQIQEIKKHSNIDSTITWVTFSGASDIKVKYSAKPISEIDIITEDQYNPNGTTAMYDGVARLINEMQQKVVDNDYTTYLILIISDGYENASKEYTAKQLADIIKEKQTTNRWTISYLGANQDLTVVNENLGFNNGNLFVYKDDSLGTNSMWNTAAVSTRCYMQSREEMTNNENTYKILSKDFIKTN